MILCGRTEEQELMAESVREFCDRYMTEADIKEWQKNHCIPEKVYKEFLEAGFAMLGLPEEIGGIPASLMDKVVLNEELHRCTGIANNLGGTGVMLTPIFRNGTPEQINFFSNIFAATGKLPVAMALSEPGAGSESIAMTTTVKERDGKLIMNGSKTFVSLGRTSDYLIVPAKDEDPSKSNNRLTLWIIPKNLPGITEVEVNDIGFKLEPFSDFYFDNVELKPEHQLGQRGTGWLTLMKTFENERPLVVAAALGIAQAAMDEAAAYCSERVVFDKPIGQFQLIQKKLVEMETKLQNVRNMLYSIAQRVDNGETDLNSEIAILKYYGPRACHEVCDDALHIFAGIGYTEDHRISRIWIDSKGFQFGGGTEEIMVKIAGKALLKKYARR